MERLSLMPPDDVRRGLVGAPDSLRHDGVLRKRNKSNPIMIAASKAPATMTSGIEELEAALDAAAAGVDVAATVPAAVGAAVPVGPTAGVEVKAAGDPVGSDTGVGADVGTATSPTPK